MARRRIELNYPRPLTFVLPQVREQSVKLWQDEIGGRALKVTVVLVVVGMGLWGYFYQKLPPQVPLLYGRPWGEAQLTTPGLLLLLPGVTLVSLVINSLVAGIAWENNLLLGRMLAITTALVGFVTTFSLVRILLLVL